MKKNWINVIVNCLKYWIDPNQITENTRIFLVDEIQRVDGYGVYSENMHISCYKTYAKQIDYPLHQSSSTIRRRARSTIEHKTYGDFFMYLDLHDRNPNIYKMHKSINKHIFINFYRYWTIKRNYIY